MSSDPLSLFHFIIQHCDIEELRTLCFALRVDFDSLPGEGKAAKTRELVSRMEKRDRLDDILDALRQMLPELFDQSSLGHGEVGADKPSVGQLGRLTVQATEFEVTLSLFESYRFGDLAAQVENSLIKEFGWQPARAYAAHFVLTELVINAFEHGCQGRGELGVTINVRLTSKKDHLIIKVTSPGEGFDFRAELEKARAQPPDAVPRSGLGLIERIADTLTGSSDGLTVQAIVGSISEGNKTLEDIVRIVTKEEGKICIVPVPCALDSRTSDDFWVSVKHLIERRFEGYVFDMTELDRLRSAGVRALVSALMQTKAVDSRMCLANLSPQTVAVFNLAGLLPLFQAYGTVAEAILAIRRMIAADEPAVARAQVGDAVARLRDPRDLNELVSVPAGRFLMGSDDGDEMAYGHEKPRHEVDLPAFRIGKYPVTNVQFQAFVEAGGYGERSYWIKAGWVWKKREGWKGPRDYGAPYNLPDHPVVGVSWYEAVAYCRWLTEVWQAEGVIGPEEVVRLSRETEWEKAARGTNGRRYPWGDDPDPARANYYETGIGATSAVGIFPGGESPYGVVDTSGNVWEWCATSRQQEYPLPLEDEWSEEYLSDTYSRVLRGGAFSSHQRLVRCANRNTSHPDFAVRNFGFRVVVAPFSPRSEL